VTTVRTVEGVYPSATSDEPIGRFFQTSQGASVESTVGLDAGLTHDIWVVVAPDMTPLNGIINKGDSLFVHEIDAIARLPKRDQARELTRMYSLRDRLVGELTDRWITHPWPTQFLIEVSPLVTWLWLGGIIAALGGLVALWPFPPRRRRGGRGPGHPSATVTTAPPATAPATRERELVTRMSARKPAT
jgi:cytochrome c-type biogenesis protein CcmF